MAHQLRRHQPEDPRRLVTLAVALIFGTALLALAVTVVAAKASGPRQGITCPLDDRQPVVAERMRHGAPPTPLVPRGAVSLTICDYNGTNATPNTPAFGLLGAYETRQRAIIHRLTVELDAIKPIPRNAVHSCPMDDASQAILNFRYMSADVVVTVGMKGCNVIRSGRIRRLGLGRPVIAQIGMLAKG